MDNMSLEETKLRIENLKTAYEHGWSWFAYHAGQRMVVFRFFFVLVGGLSVGFYQTLPKSPAIALGFSLLALVLTALFWRLDLRTQELIKIGEEFLEEIEAEFSKITEPALESA
jgi:hypothetical protein